MRLEDYLDFLTPNDIRVKGHRIGIETVLDEYLNDARTPEQIQQRYPTLRLAEVYATILYYLENQEAVTTYLDEWAEYCRRAEEEFDRNPPPVVHRLRQLQAKVAHLPPEERLAALKRLAADQREKEAQENESQDQIVYIPLGSSPR